MNAVHVCAKACWVAKYSTKYAAGQLALFPEELQAVPHFRRLTRLEGDPGVEHRSAGSIITDLDGQTEVALDFDVPSELGLADRVITAREQGEQARARESRGLNDSVENEIARGLERKRVAEMRSGAFWHLDHPEAAPDLYPELRGKH